MAKGCEGCRKGSNFAVPFSMAFQPIVDMASGISSPRRRSSADPRGRRRDHPVGADDTNRCAFDQQCRFKAIELATATRSGLAETGERMSINFLPNAVYEPRACIRLTLATAMRTGFPLNRIIFEFTENEKLDTPHVLNTLRMYKAMGFMTAIDDFGAGHA